MSLLLNDGSPAAIRRAVAKAPVKHSMKMLKRPAMGPGDGNTWPRYAKARP